MMVQLLKIGIWLSINYIKAFKVSISYIFLASKMAQWVKVIAKLSGDLSFVVGTHMNIEGENQLYIFPSTIHIHKLIYTLDLAAITYKLFQCCSGSFPFSYLTDYLST